MKSGKVEVLRDVNKYQLGFFHSENGRLSFEGKATVEAPLVTASLFASGSIVAIIALAVVAAGAVTVAITYKMKKEKGGAGNDEKE